MITLNKNNYFLNKLFCNEFKCIVKRIFSQTIVCVFFLIISVLRLISHIL